MLRATLLVTLLAWPCAAQLTGPATGVLVSSTNDAKFSVDLETTHRTLNLGDLIPEGSRVFSGGGKLQFNYYPSNSLFSFLPDLSTFRSYPAPDYDAPDLRFNLQKVRKLRQGTLIPSPWPFPVVAPALVEHSGTGKVASVVTTPISGQKQIETYLQTHDDPLLWLSRAAELENQGDLAGALSGYRRVAIAWPRAAWLQQKIDRIERLIKAREPRGSRAPQIFAILIGSTKYKSALIPELPGAEDEIALLASHLASVRGGGLPANNILVLTGGSARAAALRDAVRTTIGSKAGPGDSVFLFLSLRAVSQKSSYLLANDSDPRELASSAVSVDELSTLIQEQVPRLKQIYILGDVSFFQPFGTARAAGGKLQIGFQKTPANLDIVFTAAGRGPRGEGSLAVNLREALAGKADFDGDGRVTIEELERYLAGKYPRQKAPRAPQLTAERTSPSDANPVNRPCLASASRDCVLLAAAPPQPGLLSLAAYADQGNAASDSVASQVERALQEGRFSDAAAIVRDRPADDETRQHTVVALENAGQDVILKYLDGDEVPLEKEPFEKAAAAFASAAALVPNYAYLRERELFCRGRVLVFDHRYEEAVRVLEDSIALDPEAAYSYNALGLAYLEQGVYPAAANAFLDAVRLAPHWTYPRNNLGLTYSELGDYDASRVQFDAAIELAPRSSRLHHNSGLLFQRLNQKRQAEQEYRAAIRLNKLNHSQWEPYAALGALLASKNDFKGAEENFNTALRLEPKALAAKHDLASLYWSRKESAPKAIPLWEENIHANPDFLPSLSQLATAYVEGRQYAAAVRTYESVVKLRPDSIAMRIGLARARALSGDLNGAFFEYCEAERAKRRLNSLPTGSLRRKT